MSDASVTNDGSKPEIKQDLDSLFFDSPPKSNAEADPENFFSFFDEPEAPKKESAPEKENHLNFDFSDEKQEPAKELQAEPGQVEPVQTPSRSVRHSMKFTCLKCSAIEEHDFPEPRENELNIKCKSCSAQIKVTIEANAKRAAQKSREIYCSNCGHSLDQHIHCPSCGFFCPDYYIVENPAEAQRKARQARSNNFSQALANLKASLTWTREDSVPETITTSKPDTFDGKSGGLLSAAKKHLKLIVVSVAVLLVIGLSVFFYLKLQAEKEYVTNYIKATYAIQVASDAIMQSMTKSENDWKSALASGGSYVPKTDMDMEIRTAKINSELSKLMQKLQKNVPGKFAQPNIKLLAFHNEYSQLQKAAAATPSSYDQLSALLASSSKNLGQKKLDIKAGMNEELLGELELAKKKFRGFENF